MTDKESEMERRNTMDEKGSEFQAPSALSRMVKEIPPGWHKPKPETLPKPGYWPAMMALGIVLLLWGFALGFNEVVSSSMVMSGIGLVVFIISLAGWIGDVRDEAKHDNK
ncbi:MAG: hypothetical protein L0Y68_01315 [Candidatus Dadabacteria bacterium]|nr:hypothetical protein [Candidatus Dadabacteria bacterium]